MKKVQITSLGHPHYGETGYLVEEDVPLSLSFLGDMDKIQGENGQFFASKTDYQFV